MAYIINRFDGTQLVVLEDGTLDTSTSLGLLGRNYTGYGEVQNENFLFLLENFSNQSPPARPVSGQLWYDTTTNSLNVYSGTDWGPVGSAVVSNTEPTGFNGGLWYKTSTDQLFVFEDGFWKLIGPEGIEGFGATKLRARSVLDTGNVNRAILELLVDGNTLAVSSNINFILNDVNPIAGFSEINAGINISSTKSFSGSLIGNAESASRLNPGRLINGVYFDGQTDITITSSTTGLLTRGTYLTGSNFNGSTATTWSVDATSSNVIGKVVARDSAGDFSAGTITANLIGNVTGNVTATTGTSQFNRVEATEFVGATLSGNSFTTTRLQTGRTINGILFDGTQNITIPVAASDVTGTILSSNVVDSSLTSLGTLVGLDVSSSGYLTIGGPSPSSAPLAIRLDSGTIPYVKSNSGIVNIEIADATQPSLSAYFSFSNSNESLTLGGSSAPSLIPNTDGVLNLGISTRKWNYVYSNYFVGTATSAQYADLAENYVADSSYEPGTVLEFSGNFEVTIAEDATNKVAGVVTTNPAYLMNSHCQGEFVAAIALQGRTPCKVRGNIKKGDMLVSGGSGYARSSRNPGIGTIIGKALQDFSGIEGIIEVAVGRI
jgi:hypothetical protein